MAAFSALPQQFRIAIVGCPGVGKTSVLDLLNSGEIRDDSEPTMRPEIHSITAVSGDKHVEMRVYDTPGSPDAFEIESRLTKYHSIICAYSIDSRESLEKLPTYVNYMRGLQWITETTPLLLVGFQADLEEQRQVPREMAEGFAAQHGMAVDPMLPELSSKSLMGVQSLCFRLAGMCAKWDREQEQELEKAMQSGEVESVAGGEPDAQD